MNGTLADKIIQFNEVLKYTGKLPHGFRVLNPYIENPETMVMINLFYEKYYGDTKQRKLILGINPIRHDVGVTRVLFTDTKRL